MISKHNIKIALGILLILYISLQVIVVNKKRLMRPLKLTSDEPDSESFTTFPSTTNANATPQIVPVEKSKCSGPVNLLRGHQRQYQGFLTIGISTVPRSKAAYLKDTLTSLIHQMTDEQKQVIVIVLYLGFHNKTEVNKTIENNFNDSLSTGGLQIIQPDISVYQDLSKVTKRTYNDSMKRVRWRTKQNIDFAYLFGYSDKLSRYYMHVEDDVDAIPKYISFISDSIRKQEKSKHHWFVLGFGPGFIGKLFRSSDLCMMREFFLLFKDQKPCDFLVEDLQRIQMHDFKKVYKFKSAFNHRGKYSSLDGKIFQDEKKKTTTRPLPITTQKIYVSNLTSNPPAYIETTLKTYSNFTPTFAYIIDSKLFFWATQPKAGDYYRVKLQSQVHCSRIAIRTGAPITGADRIENAEIIISSKPTNNETCMEKISIGHLSFGRFEQSFSKLQALQCLEIIVTKKQTSWVIISQIEIET